MCSLLCLSLTKFYAWLVLFVNSICCCDTFTREELLNIRGTTPADLFPTFLTSSVELLDILVKRAPTFVHVVKRQKRGKRASVLVYLRRLGLHTPLPGIFLSNVHSLCNKQRTSATGGETQRLFFIFCFMFHKDVAVTTDTRLWLQLAGFQLFRAQRSGRTTLQQNERWRYLFLH